MDRMSRNKNMAFYECVQSGKQQENKGTMVFKKPMTYIQ